MDNGLLATYAHSPEEEDTTCHAGPHEGCPQKQSEPAGAVGGRLCRTREGGAPSSHRTLSLAWMNKRGEPSPWGGWHIWQEQNYG